MKRLTIGILAHVDSGKTTLSEALLYTAGELRKLGRVDHKNTFLDTNILERERGITIFSKQAQLHLPNAEFILLDTPGHVDFSAEMERTLQVLDYAILVISGSEGVQSHTETLWKLLQHSHVPVFLFINKKDLALKSNSEIMSELLENLDTRCID
ncbi:MAG: GTP-binding protein, partial [Oscillospiraceae bacterium]|nr:GTP-binding protein [Oscillospiraceae bacterium]